MILLSRILHFFVMHQALVIGGSLAGFVLLLTALLLVGDILLGALGRSRTLLLLSLPILAMPCLLAVAIFSIFFASSINRVFVAGNGVSGTGAITQIVPTADTISRVQNPILIPRSGSPALTSTRFDNAVFYSKPEDRSLPNVDAPFATRAIPGAESNFVIPTNDRCATLRQRVLNSSFEALLQPSGSPASGCPTLIATSTHP